MDARLTAMAGWTAFIGLLVGVMSRAFRVAGVPWLAPVVAVAVMAGIVALVYRRNRSGAWEPLVMTAAPCFLFPWWLGWSL